jgi:hypothetical protein
MLPWPAAQHVVPARIDCRSAAAAAAAEGLQQRLRLPKLLWLDLGALVVVVHNVDIHDHFDQRTTSEQLCLSLGFVTRQ